MRCFKVTNGLQDSIIQCEFSVHYFIDEFISGHPTPQKFNYFLFAFDSFEHTRGFAFFGSRTWEAEGFWKFDHLPWLPEHLQWPEGTIMFKEIKLIKEVEYS